MRKCIAYTQYIRQQHAYITRVLSVSLMHACMHKVNFSSSCTFQERRRLSYQSQRKHVTQWWHFLLIFTLLCLCSRVCRFYSIYTFLHFSSAELQTQFYLATSIIQNDSPRIIEHAHICTMHASTGILMNITRREAPCHVIPNLLSKPETFGNLTDGRIWCRHSAPTSSLVYDKNIQETWMRIERSI